MPAIAMYADADDLQSLADWLLSEPDIAWIVSVGRKRWKAVEHCNVEPGRRYCMWHEPSGPLPLHPQDPDEEVKLIEDPWADWIEPDWKPSKAHHKFNPELRKHIEETWQERNRADHPDPYFGSGHPGIIWFDAYAQGQDAPNSIAMSSFGWIGNYFKLIGRPAPPETEKWWRRLQRRVQKHAVRVTRNGPLDGPGLEIWALPSALAKIRRGVPRDLNPYLERGPTPPTT